MIRPVSVRNQSEKAPKKVDSSSNEAPKNNTGDVAAKPDKMRYVFGSEKLNVTLRISSIVFASNLPK